MEEWKLRLTAAKVEVEVEAEVELGNIKASLMKRPKSIIKAVSEIMKPDLYFCKLTKSKIGTFPH